MDNNTTQIAKERRDALSLKEKGLSRKEISILLGISERQVKRRLSNSEFAGRESIDTQYIPSLLDSGFLERPSTPTSEHNYFDSNFPDKDIGLYDHDETDMNRNNISEYISNKYKGRPVKMLNIADLHIPFTDYKTVTRILREHQDADILVINGDLFDLFAVSKYAKNKEIALRRELEEGRDFLEYVSKIFEDIIIIEGNHERRLRNYVANMIPIDMQFLIPQDIIKVAVSGEVLKKKPIANIHTVGSWWIKLFDVIIAHPDNYSGANLKTVQNTSEFFMLVKNIFHRMCIIGHTHRAGWLMSGETKLMETGCLCFEMDYHNGSKFVKTKWVKAYSVVYVDKHGESDLNRSTVHLA